MVLSFAKRHGTLLTLLGILVLAFVLRVWGLGFGLQYGYSPEEPRKVTIALDMLKNGDFHPHNFRHPSLLYDLLAVAYIPYFLVGVQQGVFHSLSDLVPPERLFLGGARVAFPTEFLVGRGMVVLFSLLTLLVVYLVCRQLYNRPVGLMACAFLAVSPIHTTWSHFIEPGSLLALLIMLTCYFSFQILETGSRRSYILAGLCAGLAISAKYNAVAVLFVPAAGHLLREDRSGWYTDDLLRAGVACILGFVVTTPYAVLDIPAFLNSFAIPVWHYATGNWGYEGNSGLWYLRTLILDTEGAIPLLALGGAVVGLRSRNRGALILLAFAVPYFLFMSLLPVHFEWHLMPLLPIIGILAAAFVHWAVLSLGAQIPLLRKNRAAVLAILTLAAILYPAARTVQRDYLLSQQDVRTTAAHWINQNLPEGSKIVQETLGPVLDQDRFSTSYLWVAIDQPLSWYREQGTDYVIFVEPMYGMLYKDPDRYQAEIERYEELFQAFALVKAFTGPYQERTGTIAVYAVH